MFSRQEKILLFSLAFIQFSHIVDFMILMPLGPQLMRVFQIDPHQFGMLVSVYTFTAGTSGVLSAFFIDRFDRKSSLLFFYVGFCIGTICCALAPNYEGLILARAVTGAFGGVLGSMILAIIGDQITPERRGSAMGITMASFSVASVFGVPFSLFLANHFSWHAPFIFLGCVSSLLIFLIIFVIKPMRKHLESRNKGDSPWEIFKHVLDSSNHITSLVFMFCLVFAQFSIIPFLSPSMVANAGLAEVQLPLIYLIGGVVSIFSSPWIGRLADRYGKARVFQYGALVSLVPIVLITNLGVTPLYLLLPLVAFFFASMGARMIPSMAMLTGTVTPRYRGSFMSLISSVQQFSSAAASYIAGVVVIKDESGHLLHYPYVGGLAVTFTVVALFLVRKIRYEESKPLTAKALDH